ncbi:MAG: hypothetical protein NE330_08290 [Lentisphaeraceae bacterium]|nr:hypothetical protein [Lentisphaeraceae bacterium]
MRILSPKQITELKNKLKLAKKLIDNTQETKDSLKWVVIYMQECENSDFVDGMLVYDELERRLSHNPEFAVNVSGLIALDYSVGLFSISTLIDGMKISKKKDKDPEESQDPDPSEEITQEEDLEDSESESKEDPEGSDLKSDPLLSE